MTEQLLPCPFCGARGLGYVLGGMRYDGPLDLEGGLGFVSAGIGWYAVRCRDCDARGPNVKASKERAAAAAIKAWNKRPTRQRGLAPQLVLFDELDG